jgi:hypothetical protein
LFLGAFATTPIFVLGVWEANVELDVPKVTKTKAGVIVNELVQSDVCAYFVIAASIHFRLVQIWSYNSCGNRAMLGHANRKKKWRADLILGSWTNVHEIESIMHNLVLK